MSELSSSLDGKLLFFKLKRLKEQIFITANSLFGSKFFMIVMAYDNQFNDFNGEWKDLRKANKEKTDESIYFSNYDSSHSIRLMPNDYPLLKKCHPNCLVLINLVNENTLS